MSHSEAGAPAATGAGTERAGTGLPSTVWDAVKNAVKRPFYLAYERRLATQAHTWDRPRHIGIIMDGNRRFARNLGQRHVLYGHARGAEKVREVAYWLTVDGELAQASLAIYEVRDGLIHRVWYYPVGPL